MTIAWGTLGYVWSKPVFIVLVKEPRYTYELMKDNDEFTISVPLNGQLKEELIFCGTKSGRDYDKFKELNLTAEYQELNTPIIKECDFHLECKVLYKQEVNGDDIPKKIHVLYYSSEGYHTMFFGEIVNTYMK